MGSPLNLRVGIVSPPHDGEVRSFAMAAAGQLTRLSVPTPRAVVGGQGTPAGFERFDLTHKGFLAWCCRHRLTDVWWFGDLPQSSSSLKNTLLQVVPDARHPWETQVTSTSPRPRISLFPHPDDYAVLLASLLPHTRGLFTLTHQQYVGIAQELGRFRERRMVRMHETNLAVTPPPILSQPPAYQQKNGFVSRILQRHSIQARESVLQGLSHLSVCVLVVDRDQGASERVASALSRVVIPPETLGEDCVARPFVDVLMAGRVDAAYASKLIDLVETEDAEEGLRRRMGVLGLPGQFRDNLGVTRAVDTASRYDVCILFNRNSSGLAVRTLASSGVHMVVPDLPIHRDLGHFLATHDAAMADLFRFYDPFPTGQRRVTCPRSLVVQTQELIADRLRERHAFAGQARRHGSLPSHVITQTLEDPTLLAREVLSVITKDESFLACRNAPLADPFGRTPEVMQHHAARWEAKKAAEDAQRRAGDKAMPASDGPSSGEE